MWALDRALTIISTRRLHNGAGQLAQQYLAYQSMEDPMALADTIIKWMNK